MPRPKEEISLLAAEIDEVPFGERRHSNCTDSSKNNNIGGDLMETAKRAGTAENLAEAAAAGGDYVVKSNGDGYNPFQDDGLQVWEKGRKEPQEEDQVVNQEAEAEEAAGQQQVRVTMYNV